jgi:hypothetical protein
MFRPQRTDKGKVAGPGAVPIPHPDPLSIFQVFSFHKDGVRRARVVTRGAGFAPPVHITHIAGMGRGVMR